MPLAAYAERPPSLVETRVIDGLAVGSCGIKSMSVDAGVFYNHTFPDIFNWDVQILVPVGGSGFGSTFSRNVTLAIMCPQLLSVHGHSQCPTNNFETSGRSFVPSSEGIFLVCRDVRVLYGYCAVSPSWITELQEKGL